MAEALGIYVTSWYIRFGLRVLPHGLCLGLRVLPHGLCLGLRVPHGHIDSQSLSHSSSGETDRQSLMVNYG